MQGGEFLSVYLKDSSDSYVLIGGNALSLILREKGVEFRATVDLDIVIIMFDSEKDGIFLRKVQDFVRNNGYIGKKFVGSNPGGCAFRFTLEDDSSDNHKPKVIELFSRKPECFDESKTTGKDHITPIEIGSGVSNLSAILVDDDVYEYIISSREIINGITTVSLECIFGLKCFAWIDNERLLGIGADGIHQYTVDKHRDDIISIIEFMVDPTDITLPNKIREYVKKSLVALRALSESDADIDGLGTAIKYISAIPGVTD